MSNNFEWAEGMACAVTAADAEGVIRYMIIRRLLKEGGTNAYTIEKEGVRKMIYQTAVTGADGRVTGIVEVSMVIPEELPHYVRS